MKYAIGKRLDRLNEKVDVLLVLVAALVDEGSDRTQAKAIAADVIKRTTALKDAIATQASNPTQAG